MAAGRFAVEGTAGVDISLERVPEVRSLGREDSLKYDVGVSDSESGLICVPP